MRGVSGGLGVRMIGDGISPSSANAEAQAMNITKPKHARTLPR
jgi:hypothetical protein